MTGYTISLGYNGATRIDYEEMWRLLKHHTRRICDDPKAIIAEARRLGSPENCRKGCCPLDTYADNYADPFDSRNGHPVSVHECENEDDEIGPHITQHASTDDPIKYHVRRAFVRLLVEAMHREAIEVNVHVS